MFLSKAELMKLQPQELSKGRPRTDIGIFVTPGIEYRISQRISLRSRVGQMGYFMETIKPDGTPTVESLSNTFRFDFNLDAVQLRC